VPQVRRRGREEGDDESVLAATRPVALWVYPGGVGPPPPPSCEAPSGPDNSTDVWPSVTFVLTLTMRDVSRAMVLLSSLSRQLRCGQASSAGTSRSEGDGGRDDVASEACWVSSLLIIVPDGEVLPRQKS
jgi:hypothetical protein